MSPSLPIAKKDELEKKLGLAMWWIDGSATNEGWIGFRIAGCDASIADDWPRQHKLLAAKAVEFYRAFDPIIQVLDNPDAPAE